MWQDASKLVPVTAIGQPVRVWQSLKGLDAILASATAATWNGTGLTFTGSEWYQLASALSLRSLCLVGSANGALQYFTDGIDGSSRFALVTRSTPDVNFANALFNANITLPMSRSVITAVSNTAASVLRIDGVEVTGTVTTGASVTLRIGVSMVTTGFLTGTISDLALYTRALTAPERAAVEGEEQAVYGVTW
jgi:hypothetical protein